MSPTKTSLAPLTPSLAEWYALLRVESPPPFRGVHHLGVCAPGVARYAIVTGAGAVVLDGIAPEPLPAPLRAQFHLMLDLADPKVATDNAPLRLVR